MNEVVWVSKNRHVIIAETNPIFSYQDKTYSIYRENWDYGKFNSTEFYSITWFFERWEDTLEEAIRYANFIPDEVYKINV